MTVNELIEKLLNKVKEGYGDNPIVTTIYSDISEIESISTEVGISRDKSGKIKEQTFVILN